MNLRDKAFQIATQAHLGQYDKAGAAYIYHPLHIASEFVDDMHYLTAILHDVIEDSGISLEDLRVYGIPSPVVTAVDSLTKRTGEDYNNYLKRVKENPIACAVKLADLRHNMRLDRLPVVTETDLARAEKYTKAIKYLTD